MSEGSIVGTTGDGAAPGFSRPARQRIAVFFALALAAIAMVAAFSAYVSLFGPRSGLPGTPLAIVTETSPADPAGFCPMARLGDVVMERHGSDLVFRQGEGEVEIIWPYGMAARLVDGKAELFAPNGIRIGTEGVTLPDFAGGYLAGNAFHVCGINGVPN